MNILSQTTLLGSLLLGVALPVQSEDWKHEFTPYFMVAGMSGVAGVGN